MNKIEKKLEPDMDITIEEESFKGREAPEMRECAS
jgi:hypothetical protein